MRAQPSPVALCLQLPLLCQVRRPFPSKPIRIIVAVTPGGGGDITSRTVAQKLNEAWRQQVIVDNRPGAGGIVGLDILTRAAPDGYTFALGGIGPLAVNQSLHSKLPYDPLKDLSPITRAVSALNVLVVHPSVPVHSVKDLMAYAKDNPANFGSSGAGRADHLAGELFNLMTGVRMQHVPYKGGAPAIVDLVAGNLQLIFATVSTAAVHMKSGRIRTIAVTSAKRVDLFPDLPTVAESGVPGFSVDNWYSFVAPAGVPRPIVAKLHSEINRVLGLSDVKERLQPLGIVPFPSESPEEFRRYIGSEIDKYAKVVKAAGLKAD